MTFEDKTELSRQSRSRRIVSTKPKSQPIPSEKKYGNIKGINIQISTFEYVKCSEPYSVLILVIR